ncbi:CapA family protein [Alsobacter sp. R-9]
MAPLLATTGQLLLHGPLETGEAAEPLRRFLSAAAAFSNLEACVDTPGAWPTKTKTLHLASRDTVAGLRDLGFRALTHANNHAFDLGPPGLARTRAVAEEAGLAFTGSGVDAASARVPAWIRTADGDVAVLAVDLGPQQDVVYAGADRPGIARLAVRRTITLPARLAGALREIDDALGESGRHRVRSAVGYEDPQDDGGFSLFGTRFVEGTAVGDWRQADPGDFASLASAFDAAREAGAALVAAVLHSHHWDADWACTPGWMLDLARRLIDAGADCVVGHGAPVLQAMAMHRGKPILAGLGNAVFHTRRGDVYRREGVDVFRGVAVRLAFSGRSCGRIEVMPLRVAEEAADGASPPPLPLTGDDAEAMLDRFTSTLSQAERALVVRVG